MMTSGDLLFHKHDLHLVMRNQEAALLKEVDDYDCSQLLNTSVEDLSDYFEAKYRIEPLVVDESGIITRQSEVDIDVSNDPLRDIRDRNGPFISKALKYLSIFHLRATGSYSTISLLSGPLIHPAAKWKVMSW